MAILCFSDVLKCVDLDPTEIKLIRHALTDQDFKTCFEKNMVLEYTRLQKFGFSKGYKYWVVFISDKGNLAKLFACYKVGDAVAFTPTLVPEGFPCPEGDCNNNMYFDLEYVELLKEYEDRLIIDWGKSARMWHQKGTTEKPIIAINANAKKTFSGFEDLILTYSELKEIIENPTVYAEWQIALSSVNAIYLIVDRESGRQYVGSAYGQDGLWGRWSSYVSSLHGNNKLIKELICVYPERYQHFQFSILQILAKTITDQDVIHIESLYKKKLLSVEFGMNNN